MGNGSGGERESAASRGWTVEGPGDAVAPEVPEQVASELAAGEEPAATDGQPDDDSGSTPHTRPDQMSNLTVVMLGVTGGISMLYAWVWMSWAQFYSTDNAVVAAGSGTVGGVLQQIVFWVAPLAPVLWFVTALTLHRKQPRKLALAVVLGLVVTFPLPMVAAMGAAL